MGKSIIAAVACKRFREHFAACHLFQYNNTRYNDPRFFLQSLSRQLCNAVQEYKENLASKLSGNKGKRLDEMNIEGLFSLLFEEPFTNVRDPGKNLLIVIDALDECREDERKKLVDLIVNHFCKFPSFIRFLITTRPEITIANKFAESNPILLEPNDKRNLEDVRLFVENKLKAMKGNDGPENVETVAANSEGLMLQASFLCELSEGSSIHSLVSIERIYESYFARLEKEHLKLNVDGNNFLLLLSVIAVAKTPLPLTILGRLFSPDEDPLSAGRKLLSLESCVSLHFVIKDECVSFLHKSIKDWLVKPKHLYSINEKRGHETLAHICVSQMEMLKQNKVKPTYDPATKYALQYGIPHLLQTEIKDVQVLTKLLVYTTDLEIVHASVCIDVYKTLNNFVSLTRYDTYKSLSEKMQERIRTLRNITRNNIYTLKEKPQLFLKHVVDENLAELSDKASELIMTKYRKLEYFDSEVGSKVTAVRSSEKVACVDILASDDFLVCGYSDGLIELFSLSDFESVWKISGVPDDVVAKQTRVMIDSLYGIPRFVVFHPLKSVIFPGQLDLVINMKGEFEPGSLNPKEEQSYAMFTNCCFSPDEKKMATHYSDRLTVWNLVNNKKITSLSCQSELYSILFSANGRFLATTDYDGFRVYDSEASYEMITKKSEKKP